MHHQVGAAALEEGRNHAPAIRTHYNKTIFPEQKILQQFIFRLICIHLHGLLVQHSVIGLRGMLLLLLFRKTPVSGDWLGQSHIAAKSNEAGLRDRLLKGNTIFFIPKLFQKPMHISAHIPYAVRYLYFTKQELI